MTSPIGIHTPHESALGHVSGEALYVDDLPEPPGMLHAMVLPSPHAHARILRRDASEALEVPGVFAVVFADDLPAANQCGPVIQDEPLLAEDEVMCVGQPVALVYAESRAACREALSRIEVDYQDLPAILSIADAIEVGSFIGTPHRIRRGDVDAAMGDAPHRLFGTLDSGPQSHFYLETHCALALPGEDRTMVVHSSTQHPSEVQALIADAVGWGRHRVTVVSPRMGGAFGGKETQGAHWAIIAALGARITGRPVKAWLDRDQDMRITGNRHPVHTRYQVGFDDDGHLLAYRASIYSDGGWAADLSLAILDRALFHADNAYWIPAVAIDGQVVRTHHVSNTAFRGFGGPQGMLPIEAIMDRIAVRLGMDPLEVRRRNLYGAAPRNLTPYHMEVVDFRVPRMLASLEQSASYARRRAEIEAFNDGSEHFKRGIAITPVKFGISFTVTHLNQAGALVVLYSDGTVQLNHGGTEMGQGLYTKMIQVCARALGIGLSSIRCMPTATDKVPNTSATAASSGSDLNGQAVAMACHTLVERLRPVAGRMLGRPAHVVFTQADEQRPGRPERARGGGEPWAWIPTGDGLSFEEVVAEAYLQQVSMSATGYYRTPGIWYDRAAGSGQPFYYFAEGVACSEVELSGLTGQWQLRRVDILHDVGDSLSPDIDLGQIEGAFVQGMGWLTCEEFLWGERGEVLTPSPSTYKVPAVGDVPTDVRVRLLERATQPGVIYGSKAVGEPPFMLAISVHRALAHAVRAFGGGDVDVDLPIPATIEALLFGVERARAAARGRVEQA